MSTGKDLLHLCFCVTRFSALTLLPSTQTIITVSSVDYSLCVFSWRWMPMLFHVSVQQRIKCWIHFSLHQHIFNLPMPKHEVSSFLQRVTKVCLVPHRYWFCTFLLCFFWFTQLLRLSVSSKQSTTHIARQKLSDWVTKQKSYSLVWLFTLYCGHSWDRHEDLRHSFFLIWRYVLAFWGYLLLWNSTQSTATMSSTERKALILSLAS